MKQMPNRDLIKNVHEWLIAEDQIISADRISKEIKIQYGKNVAKSEITIWLLQQQLPKEQVTVRGKIRIPITQGMVKNKFQC